MVSCLCGSWAGVSAPPPAVATAHLSSSVQDHFLYFIRGSSCFLHTSLVVVGLFPCSGYKRFSVSTPEVVGVASTPLQKQCVFVFVLGRRCLLSLPSCLRPLLHGRQVSREAFGALCLFPGSCWSSPVCLYHAGGSFSVSLLAPSLPHEHQWRSGKTTLIYCHALLCLGLQLFQSDTVAHF